MIEVTDEMRDAFYNQLAGGYVTPEEFKSGLTAVLAIVERDHEPIRCDDASWTGRRCTKPRGHEHGHQHRWSGTVWP